mmetsp:Transcript_108887/g.347296  ORF Transcript_108887/g.347296 Transcript_108887/m.347296 type:complete len:354 (+) Transcript_108887:497-1558(+)
MGPGGCGAPAFPAREPRQQCCLHPRRRDHRADDHGAPRRLPQHHQRRANRQPDRRVGQGDGHDPVQDAVPRDSLREPGVPVILQHGPAGVRRANYRRVHGWGAGEPALLRPGRPEGEQQRDHLQADGCQGDWDARPGRVPVGHAEDEVLVQVLQPHVHGPHAADVFPQELQHDLSSWFGIPVDDEQPRRGGQSPDERQPEDARTHRGPAQQHRDSEAAPRRGRPRAAPEASGLRRLGRLVRLQAPVQRAEGLRAGGQQRGPHTLPSRPSWSRCTPPHGCVGRNKFIVDGEQLGSRCHAKLWPRRGPPGGYEQPGGCRQRGGPRRAKARGPCCTGPDIDADAFRRAGGRGCATR